jgi:hypothetical protein
MRRAFPALNRQVAPDVGGTLLVPLEEAITTRSHASWYLHAGKTS